jgi:hypothetical protein
VAVGTSYERGVTIFPGQARFGIEWLTCDPKGVDTCCGATRYAFHALSVRSPALKRPARRGSLSLKGPRRSCPE